LLTEIACNRKHKENKELEQAYNGGNEQHHGHHHHHRD
jgi:hypothetical protein